MKKFDYYKTNNNEENYFQKEKTPKKRIEIPPNK